MLLNWRILVDEKKSAAENMAIDEAIMQSVIAGEALPTIRFYDWTRPTLSCGFNQSAEKEVDFDEVRKFQYDFVRRPTGGRVVLHKDEVTYAVIAPISDFLEGSVTESYAQISKALAAGLELLGVDVEFEKGSLSAEHQRENANPCFSSTSRYELSVQRKKIVGSAQVRKENVLLQHGSIQLHENQSIIADFMPNFSVEKKEKIRRYLERKTISINQCLNEIKNYDDVVEAMIQGFYKAWDDVHFERMERLSDQELELVKQLVEGKYCRKEWNFRK
jgi:lipoate-protein ligase A